MRNYKDEYEKRVAFIRQTLLESGAGGVVYGNSGGKDSALVGILCKAACSDTVGVAMPCASKRNFQEDMADAQAVAKQFEIEQRSLDLTAVRQALMERLSGITELCGGTVANIAPRLRMISLYAVAGSENRLVAGTGNRSEAYMGYFTKWGDGAYDFNPIADLTVTEIYEFLRYLGAPQSIIDKAPSAGLYEGQTDEQEMGISYREIDDFLLHGAVTKPASEMLERFHTASEHKRKMPLTFK